MFAACSGVKSGASSITTRPVGSCMNSRFCGSGVRHSAGVDLARISFAVGVGLACSAARAGSASRLLVSASAAMRWRRSMASPWAMDMARVAT